MSYSSIDGKSEPRQISMLIVENDLHELQVIGNSLKAFGHQLLYATSALQACRIAGAKKPDIILVNAAIASANNYELLSLLGDEFSVTPVVIMATEATPDLIDAIQDYFWIDFIQKPLNIRKLLFRISRHMEHVMLQYRSKAKDLSEFPVTKFRAEQMPAPTIKILLVEDHALNQSYLSAVLARAGYQALLAETGEEAIALAKSQEPDLILLDMVLPDMNGAMVMESIREFHQPKVIVLSGYTEKELRRDYPSLSADSYLLKPVEAAELIRQVKKYTSSQSGKAEAILYDYSYVLEITQGAGGLFQEWLLKFLSSLTDCQSHLDEVRRNKHMAINTRVFHETLNYAVYYGAHKLKEQLWEVMNKGTAHVGSTDLLTEISMEIQSLLSFYQRLSQNQNQLF